MAEKAFKWIAALYRVECEINGSPSDALKAVRQERSRSIFDALCEWLATVRPILPQPAFSEVTLRRSLKLTWAPEIEFVVFEGRPALKQQKRH